MRKLILLLPVFLIMSLSALPQITPKTNVGSQIDSLLSSKYTLNDPGLSVLVAKNGRIIYKNAFGSANLELKVAMKADMLFNLGSITKQFTAVAVLQLMEKGKLSLQDSIQKYIPQFPSKPFKITIEQLLTHTSGLKDYLQINYKEPYLERKDFTPKELIEYFKNEPLDFEPGTKYKYSNSGYFLLGYIIEMVSGKPYEEYLQENIFNKLNLRNTYYDSSNRIFSNRTYGYDKGNVYEKADYWAASIPYAAGALISNVDDLFSWHSGLLNGKLLNEQTLAKAFSPFHLNDGTKINYGYGWIINDIDGALAIGHGGAITGYKTNEVYYPAQEIYVLILANCNCAPVDELSILISGIAMGKPLQKGQRLADAVLDQYLGVYALTNDPRRKIKIVKENGSLVAYTSEKQFYPLVFTSDKKFEFKNIVDAKCEFIVQNDKVLKFIVNQNGVFNWKKIE
jgi:CubicO group peptidase (beta-lactamase class C family)